MRLFHFASDWDHNLKKTYQYDSIFSLCKKRRCFFKLPGLTSTMIIGARTQAGRVSFYDHTPTLPDGSVAGAIHINRFASIADQVTLQLFGDHDQKNLHEPAAVNC